MTAGGTRSSSLIGSFSDSPFPARGAICNVSSQAGLMGNANLPSYVATKHGVIGLTKSVSNEHRWRRESGLTEGRIVGWQEVGCPGDPRECAMSGRHRDPDVGGNARRGRG
jgi:hypothetical protein